MKNKFALFSLIVLVPTITACQDTEHSIISIRTYDDDVYFVELNKETLSNLLMSNQQFILETYSPYCSHCKELEPLLKKYSNKKDLIIYRFNTTQIENQTEWNELLADKYPDIFDEFAVPTIRYVNNAALTYKVSSNKFSSYSALSNIMDKHNISSEITLINSISALNNFSESHEKYIVYSYDLNSPKSLQLCADYIMTNEIAKAKKPIALLNKFSMSSEDFAQLKNNFLSKSDSFVSYYKKNEQIKTIDYSSDDGSKLSELLSNL